MRASSQSSKGLSASAAPAASPDIPLFDLLPPLRRVPRAAFCTLPSPVQRLSEYADLGELWIKRDDRNAPICGGNKVRALEFLLGAVQPGDTVITVGGAGSTHVLSTAIHAGRLGARTVAYRWRHDMNPVAEIVSVRITDEAAATILGRSTLVALGRAAIARVTSRAHFIPVGGSTPLGALGHVNAALELDRQIKVGLLPRPDRIVLPLGTGATMAGLAVGFAAAGLDVQLVGARVGPRLFAGRGKVLRLARATSRLIERVTRGNPIAVDPQRIQVDHRYYGGAYARPLAAGVDAAATLMRRVGIRLDDTYSAKAFAAAVNAARDLDGITLFWLTFDARCLTK